MRASLSDRVLSVCLLALLTYFLAACDQRGTESASKDPSASGVGVGSDSPATEAASTVLDALPFDNRANGLLLDDLDGDGLADIILVSHGGNTAIPFRQVAPRNFEATPPIEFMGFHPNDIIRLPFDDGSPFLINAEGDSKLRLFTFDAGLIARQTGEVTIAFPRFTTPFTWPGWGDSLVVTPYSGNFVTLFKGFDAATSDYDDKIPLDVSRSPRLVPWQPVVVDLDGDGIDELVFAVPKDRTVKALRWTGEDSAPVVDTLWTAPNGGTPHYVLPARLDADERMDLIVVGNTLKSVNVLLNEAGKGFGSVSYDLEDAIATDAALATADDGNRYLFVGTTTRFFLFEFPPNIAKPSNVWTADNYFQGMVRVGLRDLDQDGHLDAVIARNGEVFSNVIVYGPLPVNFKELSNEYDLLSPKLLSVGQDNHAN